MDKQTDRQTAKNTDGNNETKEIKRKLTDAEIMIELVEMDKEINARLETVLKKQCKREKEAKINQTKLGKMVSGFANLFAKKSNNKEQKENTCLNENK